MMFFRTLTWVRPLFHMIFSFLIYWIISLWCHLICSPIPCISCKLEVRPTGPIRFWLHILGKNPLWVILCTSQCIHIHLDRQAVSLFLMDWWMTATSPCCRSVILFVTCSKQTGRILTNHSRQRENLTKVENAGPMQVLRNGPVSLALRKEWGGRLQQDTLKLEWWKRMLFRGKGEREASELRNN